MSPEISNEQLNAFVDDELDVAEKDALFAEFEADPEVAQQVCELRAVKELVRHGYAELPVLVRKEWARQFYVPRSLVAGAMLALGLTLGWLGHDWSQSAPAAQVAQAQPQPHVAFPVGTLRPVSLAGVSEDIHKVVMHVDSADPAKFKTLLDDVDYLTRHQAVLGQPVQVEVIASHYGLNMLRSDVTPYAARINGLIQSHPNVIFVACNQTMRRLDKEGVKVKLLPHTQVTPTAIEEIVNRLQGGWTYIKV
ncbi:hypothetical protein CAP31_14005 [Sulfuriferula sp. AH1]|uniref:hypothetical protein n=1 Tax=Sulfuriferula sp. AH1 TaxID=1985873 RepID=UPI000B3B759C|nr:hypothetical protein [Sulfuriferula sp. AH1]ARU32682.1 hypothetical protein CAP31_14005 [Sulfuriferula sp. AH1]